MSRITGQRGSFLQPVRYGRNEAGEWSVMNYEGTRDEIYDQAYDANMFKGAMWEVEQGFSGAKDHLTVHLPYHYASFPNLDVTTVWELTAELIEKDLLELDVNEFDFPAGSPFLTLTFTEKGFVREMLEKQTASSWASTVEEWETNAAFAGDVFDETRAKKVYRIMSAGMKAMRVPAVRLRRTQIVNDGWGVKASVDDAKKLFSTTTMKSERFGMPGDLLFQLPDKAQPTVFADGIDKRWGWYCHYPSVRQTAVIKWTVQQEWEWGLWIKDAYGDPI